MDDNLFTLIALVATLIISGVGTGLLLRFRSFLKNIGELAIAAENCLKDDCTQQEMKEVIKEIKETAVDGLGIWSALLNLTKRG